MQGAPGGALLQQNGSWLWQSDMDKEDRKRMMSKIYTLFEEKQKKGQGNNEEWTKKLPEFVKRLEEELYKTAASKAEYEDPTTLKDRLQKAAGTFYRPGEARRPEAQPPVSNDRVSGTGMSEHGGAGQIYGMNAGYSHQPDGFQMMGRMPTAISPSQNAGPAVSVGVVSSSSGLHAASRPLPTGYMNPQQLQSPMGVNSMRLGPQADTIYGMQQGGVVKVENPGYGAGMVGVGSMGDRGGLSARPDGNSVMSNANSVMSNGMPVMLRGGRQEYPGGTNGYIQATPMGASSNILIGGMQPAQLANGQLQTGSSQTYQQYPSQRMQNGMIPNGMIPTNSTASSLQQKGMVPTGPHANPSMGTGNGPVMLSQRSSVGAPMTNGVPSGHSGAMAMPVNMSMTAGEVGGGVAMMDAERHRQMQQHALQRREQQSNPQVEQKRQEIQRQQRCTQSKELLKHHQKCTSESCPVCGPVKEHVRKQKMTAAIRSQQLNAHRASMGQQPLVGQHQATLGAAHLSGHPHQMSHLPPGRTSGAPGLTPSGSRPLQGFEGGADSHGMPHANGHHVGEPAAKRLKREPNSQMMMYQQPHPNSARLEKNQMNTGTSMVEVFTDDEIGRHLHNLVRAAQNKPLLQKGEPPGDLFARPVDASGQPSQSHCSGCLQQRLTWEPPSLYCIGCNQRIKRNQIYYVAKNKTDVKGHWCHGCYTDCKQESMEFDGQQVKKGELEKKKNDEEVEESWVNCDSCGAWVHQICALFNKGENSEGVKYHCPHCLLQGLRTGVRKRVEQRPQALLEAKDLPKCHLSDFLETYVGDVLLRERTERAKRENKPITEVETAEGLTIRVINNVMKQVDVKPRFSELFESEQYPKSFPYRQKVVLMTQKIDGVDVCLYCFYLQEYGDDCPEPNRKWVYLSYLDSVKYFKPEKQVMTPQGELALRTVVYHAVLQGYMEYAKNHGYCTIFIWACPPLQGDDYIMYVHPQRQKVPKSERLREWYHSCLRKSKADKVVTHLSNLVDTFFENGRDHRSRVSASLMPYFDGDYWPGEAEVQLGNILEENRKDSKRGTVAKGGRSKGSKGKRYGTTTKDLDARIMRNMAEAINNMKEDFIVAHLQEPCSFCRKYISNDFRWYHPDPPSKVTRSDKMFEGINLDLPGLNGKHVTSMSRFQLCNSCYESEKRTAEANGKPEGLPHNMSLSQLRQEFVPPIPSTSDDGNPEMQSEIFDTRQAFLSLCQGNHYQFDTLRRARHSSMMVLYHLHNPTQPAFVVTCNHCSSEIEPTEGGFRCTICADYDLCRNCKVAGTHPHQMVPHDRSKVFINTQHHLTASEQQERKTQMERTMTLLIHASSCTDSNCPSTNCTKVKQLFAHAKNCEKNAVGGCPLCRRMVLLLQMHAKTCHTQNCPVPRCREIKFMRSRQAQRSEDMRRVAYLKHIRAGGAPGSAMVQQQQQHRQGY